MASNRFATKDNLVDIVQGLHDAYEPADSTIVHDASYVHTDANFTTAEKTKLAGIEAGATAGGGTYTLTQSASDGHTFTFAGSDGTSTEITIPDSDTTYTISSLGIGNVKNLDQSKAIKSITRSGTTFTYTCLDGTTGTFTQQDNNTWTAMVGATSSAAGTAGYVPAPPSSGYNTKYLRADGTWTVPPNTTYTAASASPSMDGTAAVGSSAKYAREDHVHPTDTSRASASDLTSHTDDTTVHITASERTAWNAKTSNTGTVTSVATGAGLTGGTITGSGTIKAKLKSETASTLDSAAMGSTSSRQYAVGVDKSGYLSVNVPWTDTAQNQNAFSNVKVGSTTIAADGTTDTLTVTAGSNVTITPDATNDALTIAATDTTYSDATQSAHGLMSTSDKTKLDGIATGANAYTHPSHTAGTAGTSSATSGKTLAVPYVTYDSLGHVTGSGTHTHTVSGFLTSHQDISGKADASAAISKITRSGTTFTATKADGSTFTFTQQDNNTTYSNATTSAAGLMSASDKTKLDGVATGATANTGTVTSVATGVGLTGGTITGTGTIKAKLKTETAHTLSSASQTNTTSRQYAVGVDKDGYLSVNVPWSNTTYSNATLGQGYGTCATAAATAAKVVTLSSYALVAGGIVAVKFTYAVPASATMNVNSKGAKSIYYKGSAITANVIQAGDIAEFIYDGSYYHLVSVDRVSKESITGLSVSGKTVTYTKADGSTGTITTQDTNTTYSALTTTEINSAVEAAFE